MNNKFAQNFKEYRKMSNFSQEEIAEKLNVTSQAISKWECDKSYPDIEMLIKISDLFNVSLDMLLKSNKNTSNALIDNIPDDDVMRVVLCQGNKVIKSEKTEDTINISFDKSVKSIEIHGNVNIGGDVYADITAHNSISCNDVDGEVTAGGSISCDNIEGEVCAGSSISCDNIDGNVSTGKELSCDNIIGNVAVGFNLQCDNIEGNVSCGMTITCDNINGDIKECKGDINCNSISGNIEKCEKIVYIKE